MFHDLENEQTIYEDKTIAVESFKVNHRVECWGFLFREKKNIRKIDPKKIKKYNIPTSFYESLHEGKDFITKDNKVIKNEILTTPVKPRDPMHILLIPVISNR